MNIIISSQPVNLYPFGSITKYYPSCEGPPLRCGVRSRTATGRTASLCNKTKPAQPWCAFFYYSDSSYRRPRPRYSCRANTRRQHLCQTSPAPVSRSTRFTKRARSTEPCKANAGIQHPTMDGCAIHWRLPYRETVWLSKWS